MGMKIVKKNIKISFEWKLFFLSLARARHGSFCVLAVGHYKLKVP